MTSAYSISFARMVYTVTYRDRLNIIIILRVPRFPERVGGPLFQRLQSGEKGEHLRGRRTDQRYRFRYS